MAFVPIASTAQLEFIYTQDGQTVENVLHYNCNAAVNTTNLQGLATAALAWWNTNLKPLINNTVTLITVRATDQSSQTGPVIEDTTGLPLAGTQPGSGLPNNVTVAIKLITASRGRSFRGRVYHIGLGSGSVSANTIGATPRANLKAAYLAALTLSTGPTWTLGIASRYTGNAPRTTGVFTAVTDVSVNQTVDSQRRRLPERGT